MPASCCIAITKNSQRKHRHHLFQHPFSRFDGILIPNGGTGRKNLYKREACAIALLLQSLVNGAPRPHDVFVIAKGHPLDIGGSFQGGEQLGNMERETFVSRAAAPGRSCAFFSDQRSGRHLTACHAVDSIVDEKYGDLFPAIRGVDDLRRADGCQVSISLICNDCFVRTCALDASRNCGSAAMRRLHIAHIKVVVGKDGTADRD